MSSLPDPGEQGVTRKFNVDWALYLASNRDFIYARIDVRGSRNQGDKNLYETWHKLGSIEVDDYLQVVKYLKSELHFVDAKRVAVWGWSYGGYVAAAAVASPQRAFNCSIAVAPITNWLYVDSFTAERYFGLPWTAGNFMRYEKADLAHKAASFRERNLFLLHGTADGKSRDKHCRHSLTRISFRPPDAVHLQHSFSFMKSLNENGVIYRSQVSLLAVHVPVLARLLISSFISSLPPTQLYPDSNHYLDDVKYHFYRSMELYLLNCFKLEEGQDIIEMQTNKKSGGRSE